MSERIIKTTILLRNDTEANWLSANPVLSAGEAGVIRKEDGTVKLVVGDGETELSGLEYIGGDAAQHFEVSAFEELADIEVVHGGDTAVVKEEIAGGKYSYTAYVYDAELTAWKAMDGNYSASNVYFGSNLTYTVGLGTIAAPTGSGTLSVAGKSVEDLFKQILAQESKKLTLDTDWGATLTVNKATLNGEVGATITDTPKFTFKVTDIPNWDTYGGVNASGTKVGQSATGSILSVKLFDASGDISAKGNITATNTTLEHTIPTSVWKSATFTDAGESYVLSSTFVTTSATSKPITNLGNFVTGASYSNISATVPATSANYASALSVAITPSTQTSAVTTTAKGYRKGFFKYVDKSQNGGQGRYDLTAITSDIIRSLSGTTFNFNAGSKVAGSWPTTFTVPKYSKQIIFAVPVENIGTDHQYIKMNNPTLGNYLFENNGLLRTVNIVDEDETHVGLQVAGAKTGTEIEYAVWTIDPAAPFAAAATYNITYGKTKLQ